MIVQQIFGALVLVALAWAAAASTLATFHRSGPLQAAALWLVVALVYLLARGARTRFTYPRWRVHPGPGGRWGIYHPVLWHNWADDRFPTRADAQAECDRLNAGEAKS